MAITQRISAGSTRFHKRIFPSLWFGIVGLFFLGAVAAVLTRQLPLNEAPLWILPPLVVGVFGYVLFRFFVFDLVDEVLDDGDALIVRNNGAEHRVMLDQIQNVSYNGFINPPRITIMVRQPSPCGATVTFMPTFRLFPYTLHPTAKDLIERIDRTRFPR